MAAIQQIRRRQKRALDFNVEDDETVDYKKQQAANPKTEKEKKKLIDQIYQIKKTLKTNDTIAALLSMFGLLLSVWEYEDYYDDSGKAHFSISSTGQVVRFIVSASTIILLFFIVRHSKLSFQLYSLKYPLLVHGGFWSSKFSKLMFLEIFLNAIHNPPFLDINFNISQLDWTFNISVSTVIVNLMLIRVYLVLRLFALYSKWTSKIADECCEPEGCEANTVFAIKAVLKDKPYTTLLIVMVSSTIVFGLAVRNFERPYYYALPASQVTQDWSYIWNGMWLIAITMTTVGYGDYYPRTHLGRAVDVIACFWGVFLVSMMVVTLTVSSSFEAKEAKAYDILFRLNVKQELKGKAAKVLPYVIKLVAIHRKLKKKKLSPSEHLEKKISLRGALAIKLQEFKNARGLLGDYEVPAEELLRQLTEKVDRDFEEIKEILMSLVSLEQQLHQIEESQTAVMGALKECMGFTNSLQYQLGQFKANFPGAK